MRARRDIAFPGLVRYRVKAYVWVLMILGFVFALAGGFVAAGLRAQKPFERWFAIGIGVAFLVAVFASPAGGFFRRAFKPAFVLEHSGLQSPKGFLIPWDCVEAAVFFEHGGEEHFGLRLKEGVTDIGGVPIDKLLQKDVDWLAYGMPFVTMTGVLRASREELCDAFRRCGVPVRDGGSRVLGG